MTDSVFVYINPLAKQVIQLAKSRLNLGLSLKVTTGQTVYGLAHLIALDLNAYLAANDKAGAITCSKGRKNTTPPYECCNIPFAGVDEELDKKRRLHNGLPDLLFQVGLGLTKTLTAGI